jgi:hypothetical protein
MAINAVICFGAVENSAVSSHFCRVGIMFRVVCTLVGVG